MHNALDMFAQRRCRCNHKMHLSAVVTLLWLIYLLPGTHYSVRGGRGTHIQGICAWNYSVLVFNPVL